MNAYQQPNHNIQHMHQQYVRNKLFCKCTGKPIRGQPAPGVVQQRSDARLFDALDEKHHVFTNDNDDSNNDINNDDIVPTCRYCGGHVLLKSR
jgi:hypothetical protein